MSFSAFTGSLQPASSGNQSRSSSVGLTQMRSRSVIMAKPSAYELRLEHHVGVRGQELHEGAVGNVPALVQAVHDLVMHVSGDALVHHLGLPLRMEILREQADDAQDF